MPEFKNKENESVKLPDGRTVWLSRSCAVVANVWYIDKENNPHVLLGKRGKGVPDEVGKWVLACGYLDYDETLAEAAIREVYEESGLDLKGIKSNKEYVTLWDHMTEGGQPYFVNSTPSGNRQNVSFFFGYIFSGDKMPELSNKNSEPDEVEELKWVPYSEVDSYDIGFGHKKRIHDINIKDFLKSIARYEDV